MLKRLKGETGEITDVQTAHEGDTADKIVRKAILVHSGPNGEATELQSSDGPISFDADRIKEFVTQQNLMMGKLAAEYGGADKMPMGANVPILDQHADDSSDRIRGRVTGPLAVEVRSVPKVGDNVACAVAELTFLGSDTVAKILDGRLYHLSIGVDENTNTIGELSLVIEPAAPGAMVLKRGRKPSAPMPVIKKKLKGKTMGNKVTRLAKLEAMKGELTQLAKKAAAGKDRLRLTKAKADVNTRFVKLMAARKMTPAEYKKIDVLKLAKLDRSSLDTVMEIYEGREAIVRAGQQGTTHAANFIDIGTAEEREYKRLKMGARKSLAKQGVKLKAIDEDEKELAVDEDQDEKKLEGEIESSPVAGEPDAAPADTQSLDDVVQMVEENSAQIARVSSMVDAIMEELKGDDDQDAEGEEPAADGEESNLEKSEQSDKAEEEK